MYAEDATLRGYNTFEGPPAYSDAVKNTPYQAQQQSRRTDQYYPLPNGEIYSLAIAIKFTGPYSIG